MAREQLPVTPALITWARERAGFGPAEAAGKFKAIAAWEKGESGPSYAQLEAMADAFKVPVAVFFFPDVPTNLPPIEETFRTLPATDLEILEPRLKLLLRKAKAMQVNLSELNRERNPAKRLITRDLRFDSTVGAPDMAAAVRDYLEVTLDAQSQWTSPEVALERWRSKLADVGVYVFKDQFRSPRFAGFCLTDEEFPIIYVNNTTPKTRQIFTLFHELAHLLFRTSGIDLRGEHEPARPGNDAGRIEVLCNRFAAAFLIPDQAFRIALDGREPTEAVVLEIASRFNVSTLVVYRKLRDESLVDQEIYNAAQIRAEAQGGGTGGGNYYNNQMAYLGRTYIAMALSAYHKNRISERELADYLNVAPKSLATLEEKFMRGAAA